ncbi:MAG: N-acetylmuramoyl-L-alanine amidase [Candidatus Obscuribacterales bacterium]|nr:N-acetylmuramoyl-L-alanine amidase [Candidatus Obscuribacterales bacterium]
MPRSRVLTFIDRPSPNFNSRGSATVQFLVLHYTAMDTAEAAIQRLCDATIKDRVSAHYVIDEAGNIYRLVQNNQRAWHAGVSFWDGKTDLNSSSIGIEIANPGNIPYPAAQMEAVKALSKSLIAEFKIRPSYVVAHSDIAPDRKEDPGELFDWKGLSTSGIGVWPTPAKVDYDRSASWQDTDVAKFLSKLGFQSTVAPKVLITAFQRHFHQEVFATPATVGIADNETKARLACLVRRKAIADGIAASRKK